MANTACLLINSLHNQAQATATARGIGMPGAEPPYSGSKIWPDCLSRCGPSDSVRPASRRASR